MTATRIHGTASGSARRKFAASGRRTLIGAAAALLLVAVVAGCGAAEESDPAAQVATAEPQPGDTPTAEPAPAPQPAETPTAEPAPAPQPADTPAPPAPAPQPAAVPAPPAAGEQSIQFWDFDVTSTGEDLAARLSPEEVACLESRLGASFGAMLSSPLMGPAGDLLIGGAGDASPLADCLTVENLVSVNVSMLSATAGGFSAGTRDCLTGLLQEDPALAVGLASAEGPAGDAGTLRLISCLTPEEAAALTPPGEGPAPDPGEIGCLIDQLAGDPAGERIIGVLSGDDPTGEGLTMEESALLGQAVAACGIETEFGFPDPAGGPALDYGEDPAPDVIGGGTGQCTPGLILYPGDSCYYDEFSMLIQQDGSALLDGNIGGITMGNTVMNAENINLNGLAASQSGGIWTIESLP